ncbi:alpha/beta hydrolase [Streptomyces diacarni]|uniref:alpha/beta fold hydrolase n=1 Tax=Streptomyces diacarni TaxID=2800381 RepID=UPI0033DC3C3C
MSIELSHQQVTPAADPALSLHVVTAGPPSGRPFLFLHGWPESWRSWQDVMSAAAAEGARAIAVDLPGIGDSAPLATGRPKRAGTPKPAGAPKRRLAQAVHALVHHLRLDDLTLVGHDAGGMVAYAYLRQYGDLGRAVVMNTVVPGVDPWDEVLRNPYIWHFGLHAVPGLPETLVQGRQAAYFDYFYDILAADPARLTPQARAAHAAAYRSETALAAGFDLYRTFPADARDNAASAEAGSVETPMLYLRGDGEGGDLTAYARGFRRAGVTNLTTALLAGSGHFAPEEVPEQVWRHLRDFAAEGA